MPYNGGVHKSPLNSRVSTENKAYRPKNMACEPPPFIPCEPFLLGVGVVFNLLKCGWIVNGGDLSCVVPRCTLFSPFRLPKGQETTNGEKTGHIGTNCAMRPFGAAPIEWGNARGRGLKRGVRFLCDKQMMRGWKEHWFWHTKQSGLREGMCVICVTRTCDTLEMPRTPQLLPPQSAIRSARCRGKKSLEINSIRLENDRRTTWNRLLGMSVVRVDKWGE